MKLEQSLPQRIHFTGIKGVAMTALACFLHDQGYSVTGSDIGDIFPTDISLSKIGLKINIGFKSDYVRKITPDLLIYTGAHGGKNNPEVVNAVKNGIKVMPHGQALGEFMKPYFQLSVCGSHGKTTTSAMLATILSVPPINASYTIGCGNICPVGLPGRAGSGKWFITEADEYVTDPGFDDTPRFLWQTPNLAVVTNIDFDHPDAFKNINEVFSAFQKFIQKIKPRGVLIINGGDKLSRKLTYKGEIIRVGYQADCDFQIVDCLMLPKLSKFSLIGKKIKINFSILVPGNHNILNAALACIAAHYTGVSWSQIQKRITLFCGTSRRIEKIGKVGKAYIYDDYAHNPNEIKASLEALKSIYPKWKIVTIFQPHTFSRTKALLSEFTHCFNDADTVYLSDIYASAREKSDPEISSQILAEQISKYHDNVIYCSDWVSVYSLLKRHLSSSCIIVFMGAGDIFLYARNFKKSLVIDTK